MKNLQKNVLVLVIISAISVSILAFVKELTKKDYLKTMEIEENKIRKTIFPEAQLFKKITISNEDIYLAQKDKKNIGIIVKGINNRGFGGIVEVLVGINLVNKDIKAFEIVKHNETPGLGTKACEDNFKNPFKGKKFDELPEGAGDFKKRLGIDTISGATITSMAVLNAIKDAFKKALNFINNEKKLLENN